mgnify:CR=1 FL=1
MRVGRNPPRDIENGFQDLAVHLPWRQDGQKPSFPHEGKPVGIAKGKVDVMKGDHDSPPLSRQPGQLPHHEEGMPRVEGGGRLVEKPHGRPLGEGPRDLHALAFAARHRGATARTVEALAPLISGERER